MLLVIMVVALAGVTARLVDLQAIGHARFNKLARDQMVHGVTLAATRGAIFDRNGRDLALSVPRQSIYADPSSIPPSGRSGIAAALAPLLGRSVTELTAALTTPPGPRFVNLARRVSPRVAKAVAALGLTGVGQLADTKRVAPARSLAGPVIGFVGVDNQGLAGVEYKYDRSLTGVAGSLESERDPSGREIPATERREVPAKRGRDLVLTLDQSLQYLAERQLVQEVQKVHAKAGMAAIVDVRTGDVLAMANVVGPTASVPAHPAGPHERNRLLTDAFEPGSTAKVATIAAALESGKINLDTRFSVGSTIDIGGQKFPDDEDHGTSDWTVREILARSSNVGTIQIAGDVGRARLEQTMREFGFGTRTAIGFPHEQFGSLQPTTRFDPSIMGSMPIGYGISTTAMQTLGVFTTIANGGMTRPARLVMAEIDADGARHTQPRRPGRRVISAKTAGELNELLRGVVANGTGVKAAVPGYTVAGKTGTARKPPYIAPYRYMASFVGFAPAESPRLAAVVVLDDPRGEIYGGAVAAPVFSSIMQAALRLLHVPPTTSVGSNAGASNQVAGTAGGNLSAPVR